MKKAIIALLAPAFGFAPAFAADVVAPVLSSPATAASNNCGVSPYFGVSGVFGEFEGLLTGGDSYDVAGVRADGGLGFGNGLSIDGRYEYVEGDFYDASIKSDEFRVLLNYEQEVADGFSLFGGIGYGWQSHEAEGYGESLELSGDGILLNAGVKINLGCFFHSLAYTHCFTQSVELDSQGFDGGEDLGYFEVTVGYNINEQLAATLAVETQVTGDTIIEKGWVTAVGLRYNF